MVTATKDRLSSARRALEAGGARYLLSKLVGRVLKAPSDVQLARALVAGRVLEANHGRVGHGIFKGMRLLEDGAWWGDGDVTMKVLGQYERQVVEVLEGASAKGARLLVDVGAADGYYMIGALCSGLFTRSVGFELSKEGRERIWLNAQRNGVEERVEIEGAVTGDALIAAVTGEVPALVLVDIEGAEFELLTQDVLRALDDCVVIVESHPHLVKNGEINEKRLIERAAEFFEISLLRPRAASPHDFEILDGLSDLQRQVAFSEGRGSTGRWILLTPCGGWYSGN